MTKSRNIKQQRDLFVGFAFASADLFLEVSTKGGVTFALGATQSLIGLDEQEIIGKNWLELFAPEEHAGLQDLKDNANPGTRCGPLLVNLNESSADTKGILTAIKIPNRERLYVTLALSNILMEKLAVLMEEHDGPITTGFKADDMDKTKDIDKPGAQKKTADPGAITTDFEADDLKNEEAVTTDFKADDLDKTEDIGKPSALAKEAEIEAITTGFKAKDEDEIQAITTGFKAEDDVFDDSIYNKGEFVDEAEHIFEFARTENIDTDMSVFEFNKTKTISDENWMTIKEKVAALLREHAISGKAAADIGDAKYILLHDNTKNPDDMIKQIVEISKELDPEGKGVEVSSKTIKTELEQLSDHEAARALYHAISDLEKSGTSTEIQGLGSGFKELVSDNEDKLKEFKSIIERVDFDIRFQPIIDLKSGDAEHYEIFSRLRIGEIEEWIKFGEDVGLSADFDLAVVERTLNFIHYKAGTTRTKFSINISEKSIEHKDFIEKLEEHLSKRDLKDRIMFEISGSSNIQNFQKISDFVLWLKEQGYRIALDDFGPTPKALQNLKKLPVDFVKIDRKYTRKIVESEKVQLILKELNKMCNGMNIKMIAKFVEEQEQADILKSIGIRYTQGHLYREAEAAPSFIPPQK